MSENPAVTPEKAKSSEAEKAKREKAREITNQSIKMAVNSEQNFLLHFLPEILTSVQKDRDIIDDANNDGFVLNEETGLIYDKRFNTLKNDINSNGGLQRLLSYLTRGQKVNVFEKVPNSILSSFLPDIKIFKVFKGKKPTKGGNSSRKNFNWQIPFNTTINSQDIQSILNSGRGMTNNAILKSFNFEFRGTDPYSAEKNIKATLQIGFDSVDKLTEVIDVTVPDDLKPYFFDEAALAPNAIAPKKQFKYSDLILVNEEVFSKKPDPNLYIIKALIGIKEPEPKILEELSYILKNFGVDLQTLRDAITESKMVLTLYHTGHDLQFNEDGSIDFTIEYVAANETSLFDPIYDILLVDKSSVKIVDLMKEAALMREQQEALDTCFNQNKNLLDTKTELEKKAVKTSFELKNNAFKKKLELNNLEINAAKTNIKAGFLSAVQDEVPIYEVKVEPKFKSLFKQLADSKNPFSLKELTEDVYEKTTVMPEDIQRIKGQDPTLKKLLDLYKRLQKANDALVNIKKKNEIANANTQREIADLKNKLYPEQNSTSVGDFIYNITGLDFRSEDRKKLIEKIRKDPRFKDMYVPPLTDEAEIAGFFARAFNPGIKQQIDAETAAIAEREKAFKAKEKETQALQDKIQNDLTAVVDFAGQKTRFVLFGDILNLGLKCIENDPSPAEGIQFLLGFAAMGYKQMADDRRKMLEEKGLHRSAFINFYNLQDDTNNKFIEILYGMEKFPISINRLNLFFVEKIAKRNTNVYPINLFLTDLMDLITLCTKQSLSEETKSIVKLDMQKSFLFVPVEDFTKCLEAGKKNIISVQKGLLRTDPSVMVKNNKPFINLCYYYSRGFIPNFKQRLIPGSEQSIPQKNDADFNDVYNISLGSKTGILKKISYTKNKQPYHTEALMKASGEISNGKAAYPLRMKYDATITTFGSTLFRPGDHVFLNPVTISSKENATKLILDQLGIGGFYFITKASTTISDSSFESVMDAKFISYTDGGVVPNLVPTEDTRQKCAATLKGILEVK